MPTDLPPGRQVREALAAGRRRLSALADTDPARDAEVLLARVLECDRSWLYAWPEHPLAAAALDRFEALVTRRAAGVPVAYLTGRREFWSLDLEVTPDTLIPRPETELLVEWALDCRPALPPARVLELGTGSGAIALALRRERPHWPITATDRSHAALVVAGRNAARLALPVQLLVSDWWAAMDPAARFDLILSNPPYVAATDPHLGRGDLRHEPRSALAAGPLGLDDLSRIIGGARQHLAPGSWLLLEHGAAQGAAVRGLLHAAGLVAVSTRCDLGGRERVSGGRQVD